MKKIILSAAVAAMAFSTSAMAADKGIDIEVGGQAVVYYETFDSNKKDDKGMFDQDNSSANVGIQLDLGADLGNNFTFGSQLTYVGTAGLENNLVGTTKTSGTQSTKDDLTTQIMLTKIFIAKKIANTTVKIGRQELPKSLSPLAFSEGWNVFKNTFDAILVVNTDIPKTTLVGAYVSASNSPTNLDSTDELLGATTKGAYMLTVQTTAIPMTTLTASYYHLSGIGAVEAVDFAAATATSLQIDAVAKVDGYSADAYWIDAKVKPMDMLTIAGQYGEINPASDAPSISDDTTKAIGAKATVKIDALTASLAYSDVNDGSVEMRNTGTNIKTPLYTQMVYNQGAIDLDNTTYVAKVAYNLGDAGSVSVAYGMTEDNSDAKNDYNELDVVYKIKAGGVQYFAAYIMRETDENTLSGYNSASAATIAATLPTSADKEHRIRVWARYAF